jgi:hypothetical protein
MYRVVYLSLILLSVNAQLLNAQVKSIISPKLSLSTQMGITEFDRSTTALFQVKGSVELSNNYSLGIFYTVSTTEIYPISETLSNTYMDYWAAGGFIDYRIWTRNRFKLSAPVFLGFGEIQMDNESGTANLGESNFFQIEPTARLNLTITPNLGFDLGIGYRFISDVSYRNLTQSDIDGPTAYFGLTFKLFQ